MARGSKSFGQEIGNDLKNALVYAAGIFGASAGYKVMTTIVKWAFKQLERRI